MSFRTVWGGTGILREICAAFGYGHYHSGSLHTFVVLPVCLGYFIFLNSRYLKEKAPGKIARDRLNWLMAWIVLNAVIYGLDGLEMFRGLVGALVPPLKGFSMARTLWFNPFLWYLAFAAVLCRLAEKGAKKMPYILCGAAAAVIFTVPSTYNHISMNIQNQILAAWKIPGRQFTYRQFYSEQLFEEIKKAINYNGEYAIAYGMHPSILEYNGIATLDGYSQIYPQEYKEQFRRLIAPELEQDASNAAYYDNWGARAYVFSPVNGFQPVYNMQPDEEELPIDAQVFDKMGGAYVFSRIWITNAERLGMRFIGEFGDPESPYTIYVYKKQQR